MQSIGCKYDACSFCAMFRLVCVCLGFFHHPVSCVTNVTSVSVLSILDCPGFSNVYQLYRVCPVSCGPNNVSISVCYIHACTFGFL